jgi:crotonobetainyl-CoA:carnitine CoA-transferase CaiB-like acyl-CoA transferase
MGPTAGLIFAELVRQPTRIGEHNDEVLGEAGYSPGEIAALGESGVITRQSAIG